MPPLPSPTPAEPTPGPWLVSDHTPLQVFDQSTVTNHGFCICTLHGPDAEANARLIHAAPDLRDALEDAASELEWALSRLGVTMGHGDPGARMADGDSWGGEAALAAARAALAKASAP